ncbi:MAG: heparan-alpha-glucosaminide N-acetyltransferase domain-containing protein [Candidatus Xenobiia bacterium LiM19]
MTEKVSGEHFERHIMALHAMKFLGIVVMIAIHTFFWLFSSRDTCLTPRGMVYAGWISRLVFLGYFPLSLPIIAGAMYRARIEEDRGAEKTRFIHILAVSLLIILLGYVMNFLTWGKACTWDWDVLGLIGLAYLFITMMVRVSPWLLYGTAIIILVFSKAIYAAAALMPPSVQKLYMVNILVSMDSVHFYWPVVPWFALIVFGYGYYELLFHPWMQNRRNIMLTCTILSAVFLLLGLATWSGHWKFNPAEIWGSWLFHPDLSILLLLAGVFVLCSYLCYLAWPVLIKMQWLIKPFSVGILWIYLIHTVTGFHLIASLKHLLKAPVLFFPVLSILLLLSWFIGRGVEYSNNHQFEFVVKKVAKE